MERYGTLMPVTGHAWGQPSKSLPHHRKALVLTTAASHRLIITLSPSAVQVPLALSFQCCNGPAITATSPGVREGKVRPGQGSKCKDQGAGHLVSYSVSLSRLLEGEWERRDPV